MKVDIYQFLIMSRKKSVMLLIISFFLIVAGILLVKYPADYIKDEKTYIPPEPEKKYRSVREFPKNFCFLKLISQDEYRYITLEKKILQEKDCPNYEELDFLPVLQSSWIIKEKEDTVLQFLESLSLLVEKNPTFPYWISEIHFEDNYIHFFFVKKNIRIDIRDKRNWMEALLPVMIYVIEKDFNNLYIDLREEETLFLLAAEV